MVVPGSSSIRSSTHKVPCRLSKMSHLDAMFRAEIPFYEEELIVSFVVMARWKRRYIGRIQVSESLKGYQIPIVSPESGVEPSAVSRRVVLVAELVVPPFRGEASHAAQVQ